MDPAQPENPAYIPVGRNTFKHQQWKLFHENQYEEYMSLAHGGIFPGGGSEVNQGLACKWSRW